MVGEGIKGRSEVRGMAKKIGTRVGASGLGYGWD